MASFTKEVNWRLAKRPLKINGRLANRQLTSLVEESTGVQHVNLATGLILEPTYDSSTGFINAESQQPLGRFQTL